MTFQHRTLSELRALDLSGGGDNIRGSFREMFLKGQSLQTPALPIPNRASSTPLTTLKPGFYVDRLKRGSDILLALIALIVSAPVMALLALALWIEGGNPFYSQLRLGRGGRNFRMFKLRTMVMDADQRLAACLAADPALKAEWDSTQKLKSDPRVTPVGWFIRKTSLDELPQLLNVLRGDMSLVGPRPMLPDQLPLYLNPQVYLALRPGITGLWQVTARNDKAFDLRAILDTRYFERLSLWLDLRIMLATFRAVARGTGY